MPGSRDQVRHVVPPANVRVGRGHALGALPGEPPIRRQEIHLLAAVQRGRDDEPSIGHRLPRPRREDRPPLLQAERRARRVEPTWEPARALQVIGVVEAHQRQAHHREVLDRSRRGDRRLLGRGAHAQPVPDGAGHEREPHRDHREVGGLEQPWRVQELLPEPGLVAAQAQREEDALSLLPRRPSSEKRAPIGRKRNQNARIRIKSSCPSRSSGLRAARRT